MHADGSGGWRSETTGQGGQAIAGVFIAGADDRSTEVVHRILLSHPACVQAPSLTFLSEPGGLADLLQRRTTLNAFVARMRDHWYPSSPELRRECPPDRLEAVLDRFEQDWSTHHRKSARFLVGGVLGKRVADSPHVYWLNASPAHARVAHGLHAVLRDARLILVVPGVTARQLPAAPRGHRHFVRLDRLLDRTHDDEYRALIQFLDIADHGQARHALAAEFERA